MIAACVEFEREFGRRPRVLISGVGTVLDGSTAIAATLADCGLDVDLGPIVADPAGIAAQAVDSDVHLVGLMDADAELVAAVRSSLAVAGIASLPVLGGLARLRDPAELLETLRLLTAELRD